MKQLYFIICMLLLSFMAFGKSKPEIISVKASADSLAIYGLYELSVEINSKASNHFDYDESLLKAIFISPTERKIEVEGFYYQHFIPHNQTELKTSGKAQHKIRFSPDETGKWAYKLVYIDSFGSDTLDSQYFFCENAATSGFVRQFAENHSLVADNGESVFLIGENLGWVKSMYGRNNMIRYMSKMEANGMNFAKLILTPWAFQIEWDKNGFRNYSNRQQQAFMLDSVFRMAEDMGLYLMLTFAIHDELNILFKGRDWRNNPYNIEMGGCCTQPHEFFTNAEAKNAFKNRIRYLIARYGWSTKLISWGLLAEADNFSWYKQRQHQIASWSNEMADFVVKKDPYQHFISLGFALSTSNPTVWKHENIHFTQQHLYSKKEDIEANMLQQVAILQKTYQKPMLVGEFGLGHLPDSLMKWDPQGVSLHNSLWSSIMGGSFATIMPWFWDEYIDTLNLYDSYAALAKFAKSEDLSAHQYTGMHLQTKAEKQSDVILTPNFDILSLKAPSQRFNLEASGILIPSIDSMSAFLFGPNSIFATIRKPLEISAFWNNPELVSIETGGQAVDAILKISIDGLVVLQDKVSANDLIQIEVPAGKHTISIDNIGSGFQSVVEITQLIFHSFKPDIRAFARAGEQHLMAWIQNSSHNWKYIYDNGKRPQPVSGEIHFPLTAGNYDAFWYNTYSGTVDSISQHRAEENGFSIEIQNLERDIAVKIRPQLEKPMKSIRQKSDIYRKEQPLK